MGFSNKIPSLNPGLAALVAALLWVGCSWLWNNEYRVFPQGDAAYYTAMTNTIYKSEWRDQTQLISTHAKRILMPALAAAVAFLPADRAFNDFAQNPSATVAPSWNSEQAHVYSRIVRVWTYINFFLFIGFAVVVSTLMPIENAATKWLLWLNVILTPAFGLLSIMWPVMADLLALFGAVLGLALLSRGRLWPGWLIIGVSALAREQVLFLVPVAGYLIRDRLNKTILFALLPYALIHIFPLYTNIKPYSDGASEINLGTTSQGAAYVALFKYHWTVLTNQMGLVLPFTAILNIGACAVFIWGASGPLKPKLWFALVASLIFFADRHIALASLTVLLGLSQLRVGSVARLTKINTILAGLVLFKLGLLVSAQNSYWLQSEHWFRLFEPKVFRITFQVAWGIGLLVAGFAVVRSWSFRRRAVGT